MRSLEAPRGLSAELFRELEHRTTNNLQSLSAMLRQSQKQVERDPAAAIDVIDEASRRFEIMGRITGGSTVPRRP